MESGTTSSALDKLDQTNSIGSLKQKSSFPGVLRALPLKRHPVLPIRAFGIVTRAGQMPLAAEDTEVMHTRTRRALEVGSSPRRASSGHDLAHGARR